MSGPPAGTPSAGRPQPRSDAPLPGAAELLGAAPRHPLLDALLPAVRRRLADPAAVVAWYSDSPNVVDGAGPDGGPA